GRTRRAPGCTPRRTTETAPIPTRRPWERACGSRPISTSLVSAARRARSSLRCNDMACSSSTRPPTGSSPSPVRPTRAGTLTISVGVYPLQERLLHRRRLARHPGLAAAFLTAVVMTVMVGLVVFLLFIVGSRVIDLLRGAAERYQHGGTTGLLGDDVIAFLG